MSKKKGVVEFYNKKTGEIVKSSEWALFLAGDDGKTYMITVAYDNYQVKVCENVTHRIKGE